MRNFLELRSLKKYKNNTIEIKERSFFYLINLSELKSLKKYKNNTIEIVVNTSKQHETNVSEFVIKQFE